MKNTLAAKVIEGFHSQGWQALGRGGTWAGAMRPLEAYVNRKIERAVRAEREACISIIEGYRIPVGNSAAGEMACEWTYDALREIRAAIRARAQQPPATVEDRLARHGIPMPGDPK